MARWGKDQRRQKQDQRKLEREKALAAMPPKEIPIELSRSEETQELFASAEAAIAARQRKAAIAKTPEEAFAAFWKANLAGDRTAALSYMPIEQALRQDTQVREMESLANRIALDAKGRSSKLVWKEIEGEFAAVVVETDVENPKAWLRHHGLLMMKQGDEWRVFSRMGTGRPKKEHSSRLRSLFRKADQAKQGETEVSRIGGRIGVSLHAASHASPELELKLEPLFGMPHAIRVRGGAGGRKGAIPVH